MPRCLLLCSSPFILRAGFFLRLFVLVQPAAAKTPAAKTRSAPPEGGTKGTVATKAPAATANGRKQPALRVLLTNLLARSRRPMAARELAEQVLASGYQTKSHDFVGVVWVMLGKMDDTVVNVPGKGYTLKKP